MANILIVDDSKLQRMGICKRLKELGHQFVEVNNGAEALARLETENFDCVITDIHMPVLDGFGLVKGIRDKNMQLPIIVVSADVQQNVFDTMTSMGVNDFITKPVKPDSLKEVLEKYLK